MSINEVNVIIHEMYDMIQDARGIPLASDKCIFERDKLLDMLDEIKEALPEDIKKAHTIVSSRNELISQARMEAERAIKSAQSQAGETIASAKSEAERLHANARVEAESIIAQAKAKAQELVSKESVYQDAERQSKEMLDSTKRQCDDMVEKTNNQIADLRQVSNQYMDDALRQTEAAIAAALKDVQETRSKFNSLTGSQKQQQTQKKIMFDDDEFDD